MDLSELPPDSPWALVSGILGAATLPIPLGALWHIFVSPRTGPNLAIRRMQLASWTLLAIAHSVFTAFAFLTPQCETVYMHIYPCYAKLPCTANALYPLAVVTSSLGDCIGTLALLRRCRPILETIHDRRMHTFVKVAPGVAGGIAVMMITLALSSSFTLVPSPSLTPINPAFWLQSWVYVIGLSSFGVICCVCFVVMIVHVKSVLNEVDQAVKKTLLQPLSNPSAGGPSIGEVDHAAVPAKAGQHGLQSPPGPRSLLSWVHTPSAMNFKGADLEALEKAQWRHVYAMSFGCIMHVIGAFLAMVGAIPQVMVAPTVGQLMMANVGAKSYQVNELLLMTAVRRAMETHQKRTNPGSIS